MVFLLISNTFSFRDRLFNNLFPKPPSEAAAPSPTDWPQLQYNAQHIGRNSFSVAPDYEVAWVWIDKNHIVKNFVSGPNKSVTDGFASNFNFTVLFSKQMQPIIANGKAFFGSMNGTIYAVNAATGDNVWDFTSGGTIMATAAFDSGVLVFTSMDGSIYGLRENTGVKIWNYQTGAGVNAAPIIQNNTVYVGSRDGNFYALDLQTGSLKWKYTTRVEPDSPGSPFNKAPIIAPAVISEDGQTVIFGAENMFLYGLNTANGTEKWSPKKLVGQSFLYSWPVIKGGKVIVRTMSSMGGAEFLMEDVLAALSPTATWQEEKTAILNWLNQNPQQKTMYVFDVNTGQESYQVAMGRVTGNNFSSHLAVADNQDRILTYWRIRVATFFSQAGSFGTNYCPDMGGLDLTTGDRIRINNPNSQKFCPELDNGGQFSVGGDYLYMANHFRGTSAINLNNGAYTMMTIPVEAVDCGHNRYTGAIIYHGNDTDNPCNTEVTSGYISSRAVYVNSSGFSGISIAQVNNEPMLFINEGDAGLIAALKHKP